MNPQLPDDLISAYADGETSPDETQAAERLLSSSPAARRELDDFRSLSAMLKSLPAASVPGDFAQTVLHQAERESLLGTSVADAEAPSGRRRTLWISIVSFAGTAAAVAFIALMLRTQPPNATPTDNSTIADADHNKAMMSSTSPVHLDRESAESSGVPAARMMNDEKILNSSVATTQEPDNWRDLEESTQPVALNPLLYRDYDGLRTAEVGDVVEAMKSIGPDEVVVVQLIVLDRVESLNSLQLLLQRNDIEIETPANSGDVSGDSNYTFFVESNSDQISSVFAELQQEKQVAEIEVANSVPVQVLNTDFADNGYSVLPTVPADQPATGPYLANNSINRAIARQQSLELQQQSLQNYYGRDDRSLPVRRNATFDGSKSGFKSQPPAPGDSPPSTAAPMVAKDKTEDKPNANLLDSQEKKNIDVKQDPAPKESPALESRYANSRSRVLKFDDQRQQQIVESVYGNSYGSYRQMPAKGRSTIVDQLSESNRPAPPPLPELSDKELTELAAQSQPPSDPAATLLNESVDRKEPPRSVQVLFVLVPQDSLPAAPATEAKPAEPDGAS